MALKWSDKEAIRAFLDFCNFDIFWANKVFPLLGVLNVQFLGNVAYRCWSRLLFRAAVIIFSVLEVNIFESLFESSGRAFI